MPTVTVLGAGALGSVYAAWAAEAGNDVTIVCRTEHARAVERAGLTVISADGSSRVVRMRATDRPGDVPASDLVCLASKAPATAELLDGLPGHDGVRGAFSIQNGARQAEPLVARFGPRGVACVSMVGGTLVEPGVVAHTLEGATYLGPAHGVDRARGTTVAGEIAATFGMPGAELREDIVSVQWSKAVLAVAAMGLTALTRMDYHRVFELPGARSAFLDLAHEAASIAAAEGIPLVDLPGPLRAAHLVSLPRDEALESLAAIGATLRSTGQTAIRVSMLQSIERRRPTEVGAIFTDLVELGDRHGLPLPRLRLVAGVLESVDADIRAEVRPPATLR
jgi:2-dehydropantoate 2-reductase